MLFEILRFLGPVISKKNIQYSTQQKQHPTFIFFIHHVTNTFGKSSNPTTSPKTRSGIQTIESPWLVLLKLSRPPLRLIFWPHLQTLQLLGVGHLVFGGSFVAMFFGLEDVDHPKRVGPRTLYSDDKHFEKRMTFNAFWDRPREILQIVFLIHIRKPRDWAGRCCKSHMPGHSWKHLPEMHLFAPHTTLQVESLACIYSILTATGTAPIDFY